MGGKRHGARLGMHLHLWESGNSGPRSSGTLHQSRVKAMTALYIVRRMAKLFIFSAHSLYSTSTRLTLSYSTKLHIDV